MEDKQQGGRSGRCWREHWKLTCCTVNCTDFSAHLKAGFECFIRRQSCERVGVLGFQVSLIFCQMKYWPYKALSVKLMGSRVFTSWGSLAYNKYEITLIISPVKIRLTDTVREKKMFPAQEFHTHKMKWVDFLISKYNHFGLDHRGVTVSVWACCGVEGGCSCSSPKLSAGLVAPLLTTVPHHVVRSCCGMHAAVSAVSVTLVTLVVCHTSSMAQAVGNGRSGRKIWKKLLSL